MPRPIVIKMIFILLFYSLAFAQNIQYKDVALKLYNTIYDEHTANCLFRARMYHNYLISKGIEARLVIGWQGKNNFYRHAWNEIKTKGRWYIINLTNSPKTWGVWDSRYYRSLGLRLQKYYYGEFINE